MGSTRICGKLFGISGNRSRLLAGISRCLQMRDPVDAGAKPATTIRREQQWCGGLDRELAVKGGKLAGLHL
ncbi:hypothetical protein NL676_013158 [Syzygium grande]|nr:hypothetical protein NL676_013158 [Syzygium grande]